LEVEPFYSQLIRLRKITCKQAYAFSYHAAKFNSTLTLFISEEELLEKVKVLKREMGGS